MENIKTNNIISTPEITGNIGSCETKSTKEYIRNGVFTEDHRVIMTNSCTGQIVADYNYSSYGGIFILTAIFMVVLMIILLNRD